MAGNLLSLFAVIVRVNQTAGTIYLGFMKVFENP